MPKEIAPGILSWASIIEEGAIEQSKLITKLPFIAGHIALMPDVHQGLGSVVGSVIPTSGAIVPSFVGVDIGCGMIASQLNISSKSLPDNLDSWLPVMEKYIPGGVGRKIKRYGSETNVRDAIGMNGTVDIMGWQSTAISQCGTLGGGNHFIEVCVDEKDQVWIVLHSGSRGVGNKIAQKHIKLAKKLMEDYCIELPDKDLAYFTERMPEFKTYITDMHWAQDYALLNREVMMDEMLRIVQAEIPDAGEVQRINCHHNFTQKENHNGKNVWVTRKGAIKAARGDFGIIPGSMGTGTYIVSGLGNVGAFNSCSHGAGRKFSRKRAREEFTEDDIKKAMKGKHWQEKDAKYLIDEIPGAYKDIDQVMEDSKDLVEICHSLTQVLNYKGTS